MSDCLEDGNGKVGGQGITDGTTSCLKDGSNDLWTKKYRPSTFDAHVINKKKKEEFKNICLASAEPG